ncbi:acyl carrier protein [Puniceicoccus vermicola]|uniref:Acyl carrier protein n=1 Tax=Puniceicoccus vermicola TaxID=388746 RepID=A0A7X1AWJ0_9BACT|nr:acyl carrier protein [Puniceicoccus vermicola]MBC2601214.1 acyl carrier protein [Puniceicoccus vermicola]
MKLEELRATIADLFEIEGSSLTLETPFQDQGVYDSLKVVLLMAELEDQAGLSVPPEKTQELQTLQDILTFAREQGKPIEE